MDNIQPVARSLRRVPIMQDASHTVFPPRAASGEPREYGPAQKHVEGGGHRSEPQAASRKTQDACTLSPESLRRAREHYKASELALCADCELVHAKGRCPLDAPLEERCDWNPGVDPDLGRALMWTVLVLIVIASIVALLR